MEESEKALKSFLMRVKEESWEIWLKIQHLKNNIRASGPIILWHIKVETVESVTDFIFLGSKITADGDYSREIKRYLLLGSLDSILKNRHNHFVEKCPYSQICGFSRGHVRIWELNYKEGSAEELKLSNCGVGKDFWEYLG